MEPKVCSECGTEKPLTEFAKHTKAKDGLCGWCKACFKSYNANWYLENQERDRENSRIWKQNNPERFAANTRRWRKTEKARLTNSLRSRVSAALNGACKSANTRALLGCSIEFLREHLENQFQPGMAWENYGRFGWHIDHIKPCAKFDLTDPEQQRQCFHYTNLQPLWAIDNIKKGAKSA